MWRFYSSAQFRASPNPRITPPTTPPTNKAQSRSSRAVGRGHAIACHRGCPWNLVFLHPRSLIHFGGLISTHATRSNHLKYFPCFTGAKLVKFQTGRGRFQHVFHQQTHVTNERPALSACISRQSRYARPFLLRQAQDERSGRNPRKPEGPRNCADQPAIGYEMKGMACRYTSMFFWLARI